MNAGFWSLPVPSPVHLRAHVLGRLGDAAADLLAEHRVPWHLRGDRLFWRGRLGKLRGFWEGGKQRVQVPEAGILAPRLRLGRLAAAHPELLDVAFLDLGNLQHHRPPPGWDVSSPLNSSEAVDLTTELPRHRFVLDVASDLGGAPLRLTQLLASGAVVFVHEGASRELAADWLTPWEHYVPVRHDLDDLIPKLRWLRDNDAEAKAMAERAWVRFTTHIRRQDTICYMWRLLRGIADLGWHGERGSDEDFRGEEVGKGRLSEVFKAGQPLQTLAEMIRERQRGSSL
eukprot:gnl/TRDRNA2_/TRDRNA2_169243_c2_seq1.p1 gnl/TRDRNA2_/TRDRNA2_169243_c2~~gnl/TRDRNA2_/TRDRNA2_169243_c2_seq1.p1  ORF type:complete len:286 (+),score=47.11 gnl/TRDRNA2_/TRDRNA2_169243_c2_seq1:53-910(+)